MHNTIVSAGLDISIKASHVTGNQKATTATTTIDNIYHTIATSAITTWNPYYLSVLSEYYLFTLFSVNVSIMASSIEDFTTSIVAILLPGYIMH